MQSSIKIKLNESSRARKKEKTQSSISWHEMNSITTDPANIKMIIKEDTANNFMP